MKHYSTSPRIPDTEVALRIALVNEMTEAAQLEAIGWEARDRRLRLFFGVRETSPAFDSGRPCHDRSR